jgi:hypothetical protein
VSKAKDGRGRLVKGVAWRRRSSAPTTFGCVGGLAAPLEFPHPLEDG